MDFNYSPEQEAYRMQVRAWLEANQPPPLTPAEKEKLDEDLLWERNKRWHKKLYAGGWVGLNWPKEYGGRGATFIEQVIFQQELGRLGLPMGINVLGIIMTGPALMQWGTDEQKSRYLKPIIEADEIWCEGMSEPGAGSDLAAIQTRADLVGDEFIVNGQKVWTTHAHRSDFCQLFVRTDPDVPKHKGMSALLVDMRSPGVKVQPLRQITGDSEFNEIFFDDVHVPKQNLLGPLNAGWQVLVATLMHERFGISETIGGTEVILEQLVEMANGARIDGHPAIEDDEIRQQLAQFAIEVTAKKYNGLRSLSRRLKGQQPGAESSIGKLISTDLSQRMTKFATRLLGGYAMIERKSPFAPDGDWMRRILNVEMLTIAGGTSAVQKNMIGERILQLPKG
ncbi:MAG TPA: acyl-CoA dehydrogenase family protein [Candidatus Binataceae bacterium]|nr:acyl-CoA dehydrogenase family protein [Candidatus Binataceae bacterium]